MKNLWLLCFICAALVSCEKENDTLEEPAPIPFCGTVAMNEYTLLQINFTDLEFESVYHVYVNDTDTVNHDSIPIAVNFAPPMDFGNLTLQDAPSQDKVFDGDIIWMGLGQMKFPTNPFDPKSVTKGNEPSVPMPSVGDFQLIAQQAWAINELSIIPFSQLWSIADDYNGTGYYMDSSTKVGLFVYTPSVGIGNPADWDYFLVLYNQHSYYPTYPTNH